MCNCGNKRSSLATNTAARSSPNMPMQRTGPDVYFIYIGQSALSVMGNVTGRKYRFSMPGDKQAVDPRDVPAMLSVPVLRREA